MSFQRIKNAAFAEVRVQRKMLLIINTLMGVGALTCIMNAWVTAHEDTEFFPYVMSIVLFVVACLCGFLLCSMLFNDMHNKQQSDVSLAMPMTANERFFSKLLALLFIQILPMILWLVVAGAGSVLGYAVYHRGVGAVVSTFVPMILTCLSAVLFTAAVSVFWNCCCGTAAESIYFAVISAGIITMLPASMIYTIISQYARISVSLMSQHFLVLWSYVPAIVGLDQGYQGEAWFIVYTLINCLISLAAIFACSLIYKKRDGKTVGSPIIFRAVYALTMVLGVFTVLVFFRMMGIFTTGLVIAAVIYIIISIVVSRAKVTLKKLVAWLLLYVAEVVVFVAMLALGYYTSGFGYGKLTPSIKKGGEIELGVYMLNTVDESYDDVPYMSFVVSPDATANDMKEAFDIIRSCSRADKKTLNGFIKSLDNIDGLYNGYYYGYYDTDEENGNTICVELQTYDSKYGSTDTLYTQYMTPSSPEEVNAVAEKLEKLPFLEYFTEPNPYTEDYYEDDEYYEDEESDDLTESEDTADNEDTITESETAE